MTFTSRVAVAVVVSFPFPHIAHIAHSGIFAAAASKASNAISGFRHRKSRVATGKIMPKNLEMNLREVLFYSMYVLDPKLKFAKIVKQDTSRAGQSSLETGGTKYTKPYTEIGLSQCSRLRECWGRNDKQQQ